MNSIEFAERYTSVVSEMETEPDLATKLVTSTALGLMAVDVPEEFVIPQLSEKEFLRITSTAMCTGGYAVKFLGGDYQSGGQGGLGNPSFKILTASMTGAIADAYWHVQDKPDTFQVEPIATLSSLSQLRGIGSELLWRRHRTVVGKYGGSLEKYLLDRHDNETRTRGHNEGLLAEVDVALVLASIALDKNLIVLPAPPIFEQKNQYNADFLVIDPNEGKACGVQVKSAGTQEEIDKFRDNKNGVVLISGINDLESYKTFYRPDSSNKRPNITVPYSGLIVEMCNKFYDWKNSHTSIPGFNDKFFQRYIMSQRSKKQGVAQKQALYDSFQRKADHVWSKIESFLYN